MKLNLKNGLLLFWLFCGLAVFNVVSDPASLWLKIIGIMLLLVHAIEFLLFEKRIRLKGDSWAKSFCLTMLFGVLYFKF